MTASEDANKTYVLTTGEKAASRLDLLDRIFGPGTRELLKAAGLSRGMRAAEIGCGTGLTALWIAAQTGITGSLVAVDASGEQLRVARKNARKAGILNISFHQASAYSFALPRDSFDLVYSRFLMCHLDNPERALTEMRSLLKPGGILVCEDHANGGIFTEPSSHAYERLIEISDAVNRERGLDSYVALKLPRLFRAVGFARPDVHVNQILRGGKKRFWEITLREAAPAIFAAGASTLDELESICAEMQAIAQDESILLMLARVTQIWATK